MNDVDVVEINGEWIMVTRLDESLGYTEEALKLAQELEVKEV